MQHLRNVLVNQGFLSHDTGAWFIVDGQYGSTGKGLVAGAYAMMFATDFEVVTSNAGPNSGHTSYYGDEKIVLKQLPTFGVTARKMGIPVAIQMNAGAVLDPKTLMDEVRKYAEGQSVHVHAAAAVVTNSALAQDAALTGRIGSTGKGTGAAIAAKVMRDPYAVAGANADLFHAGVVVGQERVDARNVRAFVEVSQGFSLGIDRGFYPYCTSRNCDVAQATSDAGMHPHDVKAVTMVCRTFPIRVGGNSGPCYDDQQELTWEDLGLVPELTTVTKKQRRIFTWSREQFRAAVLANRPDVVVLNFLNYLEPGGVDIDQFISEVLQDYQETLGRDIPVLLGGWGPKAEDLQVLHTGSTKIGAR